jgi:hypothetical protein
LQASLYISVVQWAEVAVLLTVVLSFVTVFLFCLRRLDNIGANVMQWFKHKKLRIPTEVHLPRSTIVLPLCRLFLP